MKLILDRFETDSNGKKIAVFEAGNDFVLIDEYNIPNDIISQLSVGDILEAEIENGKIVSAKILNDETESKRNEMKSRLNNLFTKKK